jgi:predicted glycosyltransferase
MKILFDFGHPAHVNFFKPTIMQLQKEGYEIHLSVLNRGRLPDIVKREFSSFPLYVLGKHRGTTFSILWEANIKKLFQLNKLCAKIKPDVGVAVYGFLMGAVMRLRGKPNIQFSDDPERKINTRLQKWTATILSFPIFFTSPRGKIQRFRALKEWAYLSPNYIKPNAEALAEYGLNSKKYIFVREVSNGSLNYQGQQANVIAQFANKFPKGYKVVLSLEDKKTTNQYPENWILLKEPVQDIHSLIYFSKCVVSSGDSMAREGAMLGIPSVYCGFRTMLANKVMQDEKMLLCDTPENTELLMKQIVDDTLAFESQDKFRDRLREEWEDVTQYIINLIKKYK